MLKRFMFTNKYLTSKNAKQDVRMKRVCCRGLQKGLGQAVIRCVINPACMLLPEASRAFTRGVCCCMHTGKLRPSDERSGNMEHGRWCPGGRFAPIVVVARPVVVHVRGQPALRGELDALRLRQVRLLHLLSATPAVRDATLIQHPPACADKSLAFPRSDSVTELDSRVTVCLVTNLLQHRS